MISIHFYNLWKEERIMAILLFLIWLILNGRITLEIVLLGLVLAAAVYGFMLAFTEYSWQLDKKLMRSVVILIPYFFVLLWEILKSNLVVIRCVLDRRIPLQKTLATVEVPLKTDLARMILANSITLTPGTITVKVEGNRFTVHCLSRELLEGIEQSAWVRLLLKMEG